MNLGDMNAQTSRPGLPPKPPMPAFGAFSSNQRVSMLLEKQNPGIRRSTPDSEALASSDDEVDQSRVAHMASKAPKSTRRTSWLNEIPSSTRKPSMTASGPYSPTTSHPATPSGDVSSWPSATSPALSNNTWTATPGSYPWTMWNADTRKEPPSRLQETLPSPTANNRSTARFLAEDSPHAANGGLDSGLPFTFPMQPTPKTYRSQSYSVGQLDTGAVVPPTGASLTPTNRISAQIPGLKRRTSRGLTGDRSHEANVLDRVREVDDDDEEGADRRQSEEILTKSRIAQLERENADLRQKQAVHDLERTSSAPRSDRASGLAMQKPRLRGVVSEELELAIDDQEETSLYAVNRSQNSLDRRSSDYAASASDRQILGSLDNRTPEHLRKPHWQTSLGFGSIVEPPQSRRHSFAEIPTRHGSFSSNNGKPLQCNPEDSTTDPQDRDEEYGAFTSGPQEITHGDNHPCLKEEYVHNRDCADHYFNTSDVFRHTVESRIQQTYANDAYGHPHGPLSHYEPAGQPLYIVNFKCCRSDVFYIQEGTGLRVNPGDLVIVEADRGTDLGSVQHVNVTWEQARQYKEYYAEEHYKWLMMFSPQTRNGGQNPLNPNGLSGLRGAPGSAIGGMGPPGHHGGHDSTHTDLKPKMIKRLAQNHEIQALKEKEGNEARAKRMCQQKVHDHQLHMEILDAEFQMDSKKLTFYYFADNYINFNSLVTDLFKIYKTRIWMSAINPASFVTPTASLGLSPAQSASTFGRDSPGPRRRQQGVGFGANAYNQENDNRSLANVQGAGLRNPYFNPYQNPSPTSPQTGLGVPGYMTGMQNSYDPFTPYTGQPYMLNPNAPNFASNFTQGRRMANWQHTSSNDDLSGRFGGLSMGS